MEEPIDPSDKRIEKLFNSFMADINISSEMDDALTPTEIITALSEAIIAVNTVVLEMERQERNLAN